MHKCRCGKKISRYSIRCYSCEMKRRYKSGIMNNSGINNPMAGIHRYGTKSPNFKKGKPHCEICKKELKYYNTTKCKNCYLSSLFGIDNPNWKKGITKLTLSIRNCKKMNEWRNKIFKRDNYTCQICGKESCGNIESHHKIPINTIINLYQIKNIKQALNCKLLWDINWGISLCEKCHKKLPRKG